MIIMKAKILRQRLGWKNPGFQTRCGDYRLHAGWPYIYMMIMKARQGGANGT